MASVHLKGHSIFGDVMQHEQKMLQAEHDAGVPLGSVMDPSELPPPQEDLDYINFKDDKSLDEPGMRSKKRFTRSSEHFVKRVTEIQEMAGLRDPVLVLMEIANGIELIPGGLNKDGSTQFIKKPAKIDAKTRALAAAELCSYLYPKRKAVEISGSEGQPISFAIQADTTPLPVMPSEEEILAEQQRRRKAAADAEKTIEAKR